MKNLKCIVVGDRGVGKTCLLISYTSNRFPDEYVPTLFADYSMMVKVKEDTVDLMLCDTEGEYEKITAQKFAKTDIILACFSLVNLASFDSIKSNCIPQIRLNFPHTKYLLVGTKLDLRDDPNHLQQNNLQPITQEMGLQMQKEIKAEKYFESSALTFQNLKQLFEEAINCVLYKKEKEKCILF